MGLLNVCLIFFIIYYIIGHIAITIASIAFCGAIIIVIALQFQYMLACKSLHFMRTLWQCYRDGSFVPSYRRALILWRICPTWAHWVHSCIASDRQSLHVVWDRAFPTFQEEEIRRGGGGQCFEMK